MTKIKILLLGIMFLKSISIFSESPPFEIPEGFKLMAEEAAGKEFDNDSLFSGGGFMLKSEKGTIIYSIACDLPLEFSLDELKSNLEETYVWPYYTVETEEEIEDKGSSWFLFEGKTLFRGEPKAFILIATLENKHPLEILGLSAYCEKESLREIMKRIAMEYFDDIEPVAGGDATR